MLSKVSIVNQALLRCGHYNQVEQLDFGNPQTAEEMLATRFYDDTRKECLTMGPWNFAEVEGVLTELSDWDGESKKWAYAYAYPSNCLMAREAVSLYSEDPVDFVVGLYPNDPPIGEVRIIKTKYQAQILVYTFDFDDPSRYTPSFASMFAWKLAISFGAALGLNEKQISTLINGFNGDLSTALAINGNERQDDLDETPDWLVGRD